MERLNYGALFASCEVSNHVDTSSPVDTASHVGTAGHVDMCSPVDTSNPMDASILLDLFIGTRHCVSVVVSYRCAPVWGELALKCG